MFCVRAGNKQKRKFIPKQLKWKINCKYNIKQVKFVLIFVFLSAKKSTPQQLQALVLHMQDNPDMARGAPIFGASRSSTEDEWKKIK